MSWQLQLANLDFDVPPTTLSAQFAALASAIERESPREHWRPLHNGLSLLMGANGAGNTALLPKLRRELLEQGDRLTIEYERSQLRKAA